MNATRHTSRRAAAKLVRSWWESHQRLQCELDARRRDAKIASPRPARGQTVSDAQWVQEQIVRLDAEIAISAAVGARLYNHPRTRGCFDAPLIPTDAVLAWAPPTPTLSYRSWQGAYSRRAERRDMRRCYGADWWRPADND